MKKFVAMLLTIALLISGTAISAFAYSTGFDDGEINAGELFGELSVAFEEATVIAGESVTISSPRLRSADAAEACLSASMIFGKSITFLLPWNVFSDRNRVAYNHLCIDGLLRTETKWREKPPTARGRVSGG